MLSNDEVQALPDDPEASPVLDGSLRNTAVVIEVTRPDGKRKTQVTVVQALQMLHVLLEEKAAKDAEVARLKGAAMDSMVKSLKDEEEMAGEIARLKAEKGRLDRALKEIENHREFHSGMHEMECAMNYAFDYARKIAKQAREGWDVDDPLSTLED